MTHSSSSSLLHRVSSTAVMSLIFILLVIVTTTTPTFFVDATIVPRVTSAFTFSSGFTADDLVIFGNVPDNGGTSVIENLHNVKWVNISVDFGRNTKLIIRNTRAEVGFYVGGWLREGFELEILNNIMPATSVDYPSIWFEPRIVGIVKNVLVYKNRMARQASIAGRLRDVIYFEPYITESTGPNPDQKINNITIAENEIDCTPLDNGRCTTITITPPHWLLQPLYNIVSLERNIITLTAFASVVPPQLLGFNFSVTSTIKALTFNSNIVTLRSGENMLAVSILNARFAENITIFNNTATLIPRVRKTGNCSFLIVGRSALDQLGNETNSSATRRTRSRVFPISVSNRFIFQQNNITQPYAILFKNNASWGVHIVDLYSTPLLRITNNTFNLSTSERTSFGINLGNITSIDEIEIDNNQYSCGGDSASRQYAAMVKFDQPFKSISSLKVTNSTFETWGTIPSSFGVLFVGSFDSVTFIEVSDIATRVLSTFTKTFYIVHFTSFRSSSLENITINNIDAVGKDSSFEMVKIITIDSNTEIDVKGFQVTNCDLDVTSSAQLLSIDKKLVVSDQFLLEKNTFKSRVTGNNALKSSFIAFGSDAEVDVKCDAEILDNLIDIRAGDNDAYLIHIPSTGFLGLGSVAINFKKIVLKNNDITMKSDSNPTCVLKLAAKGIDTIIEDNIFDLEATDENQAGVADIQEVSVPLTSTIEFTFINNKLTSKVLGKSSTTAPIRLKIAKIKDLQVRGNTVSVDGGRANGIFMHLTANFDTAQISDNNITCTANTGTTLGIRDGDSVGVFSTDTILLASDPVVLNISNNKVLLGCPSDCFVSQIKTMISTNAERNTVKINMKENDIVFSKTKLQYYGSMLMMKSEGSTTQNWFTSASFDPEIRVFDIAFALNNNSIRVDDNDSLSDSDTKVVILWYNSAVTSNNKHFAMEIESNTMKRANGFKGSLGLVCMHCTHNNVANNSNKFPIHGKFSFMFNEIDVGSRVAGSAFMFGSLQDHGIMGLPSFPTESYNLNFQANGIRCRDCIVTSRMLAGYSGKTKLIYWSLDASAPCNYVRDDANDRTHEFLFKHYAAAYDGCKMVIIGCGSMTDSPSITLTHEESNTTSLTGETPTQSDNSTLTTTLSKTTTASTTFTIPPTRSKSLTKSRNTESITVSLTPNDTSTHTYSAETASFPSGTETAPFTPSATETETNESLTKTFSNPTKSNSDSETTHSLSLDWVVIPLPGLNPEERRKLSQATGSILTISMAMAPTPVAGLGASRGLAVFSLLGCRENDVAAQPWRTRPLMYPFSLVPTIGFGDDDGYYARAAIYSFAIPIVLAVIIASIVGYTRVSKTLKKMEESKSKRKREKRRETRKMDKALKGSAESLAAGTHEIWLAFEKEQEQKQKAERRSTTDSLFKLIMLRSPFPDYLAQVLSMFAGSLPVASGILLGIAQADEYTHPERSTYDTRLALAGMGLMAGTVFCCCFYCTYTVYSKKGPRLTEAAVYYSSNDFVHKWSARCLLTQVAKWTIVHPKIYDVPAGSSPEKVLKARQFVQRMRMFTDFWGPEAELDELSEELEDQHKELREKVRSDQRKQRIELIEAKKEAELNSEPLLSAREAFSCTTTPQANADGLSHLSNKKRNRRNGNTNNDDDDSDDEEEEEDEEEESSSSDDDDDEIGSNEDPTFREYRNDLDDDFFEGSPAYLCHANEFSTRWELAELERRKNAMEDRMRGNNVSPAAESSTKTTPPEVELLDNNNNEEGEEMKSKEEEDEEEEEEEEDDEEDFEIQTKIYRNKCQQFVAVNFIGIAFAASFVVALLQGYAFVSSSERCEQLLAAICGINIFMLPLTLYVRPCMIPVDNVLLLFVEFCTFVGSMLALFVPPPPPFTADINAAQKILMSDEYDRSYKLYMITQLSLTSSGLVVSFLLITVGIARFGMLIVSNAKIISLGLYRKRVAQEIAFLNIFNKKKVNMKDAFLDDDEGAMEADEIMF